MGDSFHGIMAFALMAAMLFLGGVLRKRIPFLQQSLVPASILGGVLGFVLLSFALIPGYTPADFNSLTFHFFTLSFMSLCLTGSSNEKALAGDGVVRGGIWLTLIWTASLGLQALIGYGLIVFYDAVTGSQVGPLLGALITHGFTQGPGQALTYGGIWEQEYGIANAAQVGLIYASIGFLVAFLVGVPAARHVIKKGQNANKRSRIDETFLVGFFHANRGQSATRLVTHSANMDSLAWHLGLLGIAYGITHIWLSFMQKVALGHAPFGISIAVLFSHNMFFVHGLGVCVLMRLIIDKAGWSSYVDDETLKRITGASVDFMVVGTIMSIAFSVLYALLAPVLLVATAVTIATFILCWYSAKLSGKLAPERALTSFGCCTGSTGTGLLLLRLVDADFSTSVAKELAFFNLAIVLVNLPVLFILTPIAPSLDPNTYLLAFAATAFIPLVLMPLMIKKTTPALKPSMVGG
ncbi:sodium/glutamate symporter [Paenalcaligenes hermetiae]|uniref:Sodium:glutamate symporter n=1 Tax=Paenalcaligenes hermetiae TaxID=1157987 RepID=A0ABP9M0C6_9BURK